jgi:hypothetical protein
MVFKIKAWRIGNWTGNLNYWTGGTQSCKGKWGWCAGNKFKSFTANLTWFPEHFKDENCLHFKIFSNRSSILDDRACKSKFVYACQVQILGYYYQICFIDYYVQGKPVADAPCAQPTCPQTCTLNVNCYAYI